MTEKCFYCEKPAVRWCDYTIGGPIAGYARVGPASDNRFYACFDIKQLPYTCDMPMCEDHSAQVGSIFMPNDIETIDHCPEHAGKSDHKSCPCTEEEAAAERRDIQAHARRRIIAEQNRRQPVKIEVVAKEQQK